MDFRRIQRAVLWMKPHTFLSVIQKLGYCVHNYSMRGETVLYITKAMYTRCCVELDIMLREEEEARQENEEASSSESESEEEEAGVQGDRDAEAAGQDNEDEVAEPPATERRARQS